MESTCPPKTVDVPLKGEWKCFSLPGHHPYALDFAGLLADKSQVCRGGLLRYAVSSVPVSDWHGWSRPIVSPCDGVVRRVGDFWPDRTHVNFFRELFSAYLQSFRFRPDLGDPNIDLRPNIGNFVMIQSGSGFVALLAHLRAGSVKVQLGQRVRAGQVLGELGCSGNSTAPHLHFNLFDQVDDLFKTQIVPFRFHRFERWNKTHWEVFENTLPRNGDRIRVL